MKRLGPVVTLAVAVAVAAACGGDGGTPSADGSDGAKVADASGCVACHGDGGEGGVGPSWTGLAGSTVTLEDGREVVADAAYIRRAIVDPGADVVEGYTVQMPKVELTGEETDALVAYIESLGDTAGS